MNTKHSSAIAGMALFGLLGCTTPPATEWVATPPPMIQFSIPLPKDEPGKAPMGKICHLDQSCLAMDPRPFEPCLLSTKHCSDKATEPMLVAPPPQSIPLPRVESL